MNWEITYGATVQRCAKCIRQDWFDAALEVLKRDGADAWRVMLKGC